MTNTIIGSQLAVDPALVMDSNYKPNAADRRKIDDQIRAIEQLMVDNLINGKHATWYTLSGESEAVTAGDTVCLASIPGLVTKCTAEALAPAGAGLGVVLSAVSPGSKVLVAIGGVIPSSITGLNSIEGSGYGRIDTTTSRIERVSSLTFGDYPIGNIDSVGTLQINTLSFLPPSVTGEVADDIAKSTGSSIDRVRGIRAVSISGSDGDVPPIGGTIVYNENGADSYKFKKPVMPGYFDVEDFGAIPDFNFSSPGDATDNLAAFNAALAAALDSGYKGAKVVASGQFYLSGTIDIEQTVIFEGTSRGEATAGASNRSASGTLLVFPENCDGIRVWSTLSAGRGSGEHTVIRNLTLWCKNTRDSDDLTGETGAKPPGDFTGNGIRINSPCIIENVKIDNFAECGFLNSGSAGVGDVGVDHGNSGGSTFRACDVVGCGKTGFRTIGSDASANTYDTCYTAINYGWGFWDESTGGSTYVTCEGQGNIASNPGESITGGYAGDSRNHDFKAGGDFTPTNPCTFIGCYTEAADNELNVYCTALGGFLGQQMGVSSPAAFGMSAGVATAGPYRYRRDGGGTITGGVVSSLGSKDDSQSAWMAETWGDFPGTGVQLRRAVIDTFAHAGWWYVGYMDGSETGHADIIRFPSDVSRYGRPLLKAPWLPHGVLIGDGNGTTQDQILHIAAASPPTTFYANNVLVGRTYIKGDIIWNTDTPDILLGWVCTDSGTQDTLVGVTAITTSGLDIVNVNTVSGLYVGAMITIVGVTGTKTITDITGTQLTVDSTCDATVVTQAVAYSGATLVPMTSPSGTVLTAGDVILQGSPNHAGDHLLIQDDRSNHATRMHIEPHQHPTGTRAKIDIMFDPYEDDGTNYRLMNLVTTDDQGTTGVNGAGFFAIKATGDAFGVWPAMHIGFQDANSTGVPLKLYNFDHSDSAWRTPMIGAWRAGLAVTSGDYCLANFKLYQSGTTGSTGATKPSHTSGLVNDGTVDWTFVRDYSAHSGTIHPIVMIGDRDTMPKFGFAGYKLQIADDSLIWNAKHLSFLNSTNAAEAWRVYCKTGGADDLYIANLAETQYIRLGGTSKVFQTTGVTRTLGSVTESSNSATPDVKGAEILGFANTVSTTVTSFTNGAANQRLFVRSSNGNTILQHNANIITSTGLDKPLAANQVLEFIFSGSGTVAVEVGGPRPPSQSGSNIALTTGTKTLSAAEYRWDYLKFDGTLSGNTTIVLPSMDGRTWLVDATHVTFAGHTITLNANSVNWSTTIGSAALYQVTYNSSLGALVGITLAS